MKKILIFLSVLLIGLYSCKEQPKVDEANVVSNVEAKIDETYMTQLRAQVDDTKKQLPAEMGPLTYIDVELDEEAGVLTHSYQYANNIEITDEQVEGVKQNIISMMKSTPTERMPIDKGLTMCFKYYSRNRDLLYTVTINSDDL